MLQRVDDDDPSLGPLGAHRRESRDVISGNMRGQFHTCRDKGWSHVNVEEFMYLAVIVER